MARRVVEVRGTVQGVGFRPFVFNLALRHRLGGFVQNQTGRVVIEIEGEPAALDAFLTELADHPPPLARIEHLAWEECPPRGAEAFRIVDSAEGPGAVFISPDVATCSDCLREVFDPADRRCGYPFLNCTNCGPRLTIITSAPYDRARTTMAGFVLCAACRAEYDDPHNRRFHAQPTACPACGPQLQLLDANGQPIGGANPLADFAGAIGAGRIGALKGLGGYHLVCDARNATAVAELRRCKHRDEKPLALMLPDIGAVEAVCEVGVDERELLESPAAPIVLLRKRLGAGVAPNVAPGNPCLGVMLPYTPLHHLLVRAVGGIPLVMTSGNRSDEPIVYRDDAVEKLAGIADVYLVHDRPIHVRCDDSVTRVVDGAEVPVRRSRGYAPRPVALPLECPHPVLALGGQLKSTFALAHGRRAILSHHLGDLDHAEAFRAFESAVPLYEQLFALAPECLVHDLHPDYASTRYARERADRSGERLVGVQHHHAHMAACMVENGLLEPVIGVTFDGTGYGTDGTVWGGEFLVGDYGGYRRAAHLRCVGMPGGEWAVREPWRMAVAHLADAGAGFGSVSARCGARELATVRTVLERRLNAPLASSAGRLFDAVAAIAGVRTHVSYEGQAAIELEALATDVLPDVAYPFEVSAGRPDPHAPPVQVIDTRPLIRAVAQDAATGAGAARIARRFHSTVVEIVAAVCIRLRAETGLDAVVLSGGVFLNALLTRAVCARLGGDGFRVYRHRLVPPNDGGLALGQLAVAVRATCEVRNPAGPSGAS
jgi:hydrogenase maturation protein HypF